MARLFDVRFLAAVAIGGIALGAGCWRQSGQQPITVVEANDNRHAAGNMRGETLFVHFEVRTGRWFPEDPKGQYLDLPVLGEVGEHVRTIAFSA